MTLSLLLDPVASAPDDYVLGHSIPRLLLSLLGETFVNAAIGAIVAVSHSEANQPQSPLIMTMLLIRLLMLTLLFGTPVYWLGRILWQGLRTGKIRHTDSRRYCSRQQNPLGYWALVLLFATLCWLCLYGYWLLISRIVGL